MLKALTVRFLQKPVPCLLVLTGASYRNCVRSIVQENYVICKLDTMGLSVPERRVMLKYNPLPAPFAFLRGTSWLWRHSCGQSTATSDSRPLGSDTSFSLGRPLELVFGAGIYYDPDEPAIVVVLLLRHSICLNQGLAYLPAKEYFCQTINWKFQLFHLEKRDIWTIRKTVQFGMGIYRKFQHNNKLCCVLYKSGLFNSLYRLSVSCL